jgi:putative DNA methylase
MPNTPSINRRKKLIEVALPLEAINIACKADKDRKTGHIRNIHKWFAPMPLPALRALIFAAVMDAPDTDARTQELLDLIGDLVENGPEAPSEQVLRRARAELQGQLGSQEAWVLDPFCGGGSTLVEAQRLGLRAEGSDLNPIPNLISRALTVLPVRNRGKKPLVANSLLESDGTLSGFRSDIKSYAAQVRKKVLDSIGTLYPLAPNGDPVVYWWWAHTVPSPDPAFGHCKTPLATTWWLSLRTGDEQYLVPEPDANAGTIRFRVASGGTPPAASKDRCLFSNTPITYKYVREQAAAGKLGRMLLAIVSDGDHGRKYWTPDEVHTQAANVGRPEGLPQLAIPDDGLGISVRNYSVEEWSELFTHRQQRMLLAFAEAIRDVPKAVVADGGTEQQGRDIAMFLGLCLGKLAQAASTIVRLNVRKGPTAKAEPAFARGDIQLNWDFAETNPFGASVGDWNQVVTTALRAYGLVDSSGPIATVRQADARQSGADHPGKYLVVTDPPYFAAIGYADLSEYFYYWIRIALKDVCPDLFATVGVPKVTELIASPGRHGGRVKAGEHFVSGFTETFTHLAEIAHDDFPIVVVYAQKQEEKADEGDASTGWEAMLEAIIQAGLGITGTWPISGTGSARMRAHGANSLASYIVMVCRPHRQALPAASRRDFANALKAELPTALAQLQRGNIAPVDLAQAALGPGMAVYTRYSRVLDAEGKPLGVRDALALINRTLDEAMTEQEGDLDADTRWALTWFEQSGFAEGDYGVAEQLSKSKNTSVAGMEQAGILSSSRGKVRLFRPSELPSDWDPTTDTRLTAWEVVHHLIRALEAGGEAAAASLAAKLGSKAEVARELAYRLFTTCERRKRSAEGLAYNGLVLSWPEITRLAREGGKARPKQAQMFTETGAEE